MKTSKSGFQSAAQEECGVWLDTLQLKGKARQKRSARPISKMLNPFAEGGGYSLAVALNFTQTKMEMPKTKQSSISTFFTPQRRVVNRIKWTFSKPPSPLKHTDQLRSKAGRDGDSKGTKLSSSPLKKLKQQSRQVEEDSLAMLFTQDSEGFRVIAHRGLLPRSPLKDQSNQSVGIMRACAHKSVSDEEDDEVLFTQDSQGNTVIKH
ncbi:unnamed protein product [Menidia menidia]|uniref:(Atlantic silverside) hypothetical protein n=1 Tax=Menidia menidia TaxID=238744 RepID=A0A8S4AN63_9TELE|nr:unnamed protein product [Menidia menidia]